MAHPKSKRMALRSAYCYKALSLEEAAALVGISIGTARRWKVDAQKAEDDDWDKVKAASSLAGEGMEAKVKLELTYLMIEVDGQQLLEVDKLNGIYKVNGTDMLAGVNSLI